MKHALIFILFLLPCVAFSQRNRAVELMGGLAINNGNSGYHLHAAAGPQWNHFAFGIYSSFLNTPSNKFSNWTILGMQFKGLVGEGSLKPYGVFNFGLFNFQTINEKVNMRTASLDLGAGINNTLRNGNAFLLDLRWKWLVDYAAKRETIGVMTLSAGMRF